MSPTQRKTPIELHRMGIAALDPVESIRFLRLLDPSSGDYTAERQARIDQNPSTVDELCRKIQPTNECSDT